MSEGGVSPEEVSSAEVKVEPSILKQKVDAYIQRPRNEKPAFLGVNNMPPKELKDTVKNVEAAILPRSLKGSESDEWLRALKNYINVASGDINGFGGEDEIKRGAKEVVEDALSTVDVSKLTEDEKDQDFRIGQYSNQPELENN